MLRETIEQIREHAPRMRTINACMIVLASILALASLQTIMEVADLQKQVREETASYAACVNAADELRTAATYLSTQAQLFVLTQDQAYLNNYVVEEAISKREQKAIATLSGYLSVYDVSLEFSETTEGLAKLDVTERHALSLVATACGFSFPDNYREAFEVELNDGEKKLTPLEQVQRAHDLLFDGDYQSSHSRAMRYLQYSLDAMVESSEASQAEAIEHLSELLQKEHRLIMALLLVVVCTILMVVFLILWPLGAFIAQISHGRALARRGTYELRFLADSYNKMYDATRSREQELQYVAEHDPLTGLYNRGVYEGITATLGQSAAILIFDVDYFKEVNDTYGHVVGDEVLRRVAQAITATFDDCGICCRIGGDEFSVVMSGVDPACRDSVASRIMEVRRSVAQVAAGRPQVTLSIGVAFSHAYSADGVDGTGATFKAADRALYHVKEHGRNDFAFADDLAQETRG